MTEDEAETKWCFAFTASHTDPRKREHVSRDLHDPADGPFVHHCIGSACMAWRSTGEPKFRNAATGALTDRDLTGHGKWEHPFGFCGLAGAPQ